MTNFNLNEALENPQLLEQATFKRYPTPEERVSKTKREEWEDAVKHIKDLSISGFALIATGAFLYLCISLISSPIASADDKKWATSFVTLVISGIIGYLTGKSNK